MTVIEKILNEWAYRCSDGIVDLNDPQKVRILFEIIRPALAEDIDDDILNALISADSDTKSQVLKFIKKSTSKSAEKSDDGFFKYLDKHNITPDTLDEFDVTEKLFEILTNNDDLDKFNSYRKSPNSFSSLGQTGNLVSALADSGVSQDSITQIINLAGTKSGIGIGKAEVALALFLSDVVMSKSKGDLLWDGNYLEVKGSNARLGTRGTNPSLLSSSKLGQLAAEQENDDNRIDTLIYSLAEELDNKQVYEASADYLKSVFPTADITKYFSVDDLKSPKTIRKALDKIYIDNYTKKEDVKHFIFIDTKGGNYVSFSPNQIEDVVDNNLVKIGSYTANNMNPQLR